MESPKLGTTVEETAKPRAPLTISRNKEGEKRGRQIISTNVRCNLLVRFDVSVRWCLFDSDDGGDGPSDSFMIQPTVGEDLPWLNRTNV